MGGPSQKKISVNKEALQKLRDRDNGLFHQLDSSTNGLFHQLDSSTNWPFKLLKTPYFIPTTFPISFNDTTFQNF